MSGQHSRLSASSAERWMNCAASVRLSADMPDNTSEAAAEGTWAHHIAAECLKPAEVWLPERWLGNKTIIDGHEVECDQEMVDGIHLYLDALAADEEDGDKTWTEMGLLEVLQKVDPEMGGTADRVRYRPSTKVVRVTDLKYGRGTYVDVNENKQAKIYALGVLLKLLEMKLLVEKIELCIVQPRYTAAPPVRVFEFDAVELMDFSADLVAAAIETRKDDNEPVPGAWCKKTFCPVARTCPAMDKYRHEVMAMEFSEVTTYDVNQLAKGLDMIEPLKAKIKAMEAFAYSEAAKGVKIPGWKLVDKRPTRYFKDETETVEWAVANAIDPYEKKLRSPAQLEAAAAESAPKGKKKEAKAALAHLIDSKSSGTTLAPEDDKREPVKRIADATDFAVVDGTAKALPAPTTSVTDLF